MKKSMRTAAAALTLGLGLVGLTPSTSSAVVEAKICDGWAVVTCTKIVPQGGHNVIARATITDRDGGENFKVKVEYLHMQRRVNKGAWATVKWNQDLGDGWRDEWDGADTSVYTCGPNTEVRSVATFTWTGDAPEKQYGKITPCGPRR